MQSITLDPSPPLLLSPSQPLSKESWPPAVLSSPCGPPTSTAPSPKSKKRLTPAPLRTEKLPPWPPLRKNAKGLHTEGYARVCVGSRSWLLHRLIMAQHLGRPLLPHEDVHHIDGNKVNNALSNLQLLSHGHHSRTTKTVRPVILHCWLCGQPKHSAQASAFTRDCNPETKHIFCSRQCFHAWRRQLLAAQRYQCPFPTKAPPCPLENLLFPT